MERATQSSENEKCNSLFTFESAEEGIVEELEVYYLGLLFFFFFLVLLLMLIITIIIILLNFVYFSQNKMLIYRI